MKLRPLFARVLLKRDKFEVSKGGIVIPVSAQKRHSENVGVVLAVGPAADPTIEVGARVMIGKMAGDWISQGGEEVYIAQDEDLLCVIEDDPPSPALAAVA